MRTNGETKSAPDQVTVARHSPSQSRWAAQESALEFGRFQMLLRRWQLIADGDIIRTEFSRGYRFTPAVKSAVPGSAFQREARRLRRPDQRAVLQWVARVSFPERGHDLCRPL